MIKVTHEVTVDGPKVTVECSTVDEHFEYVKYDALYSDDEDNITNEIKGEAESGVERENKIEVTMLQNGSLSLIKRLDDKPAGLAIGLNIHSGYTPSEVGVLVIDMLSKGE